jgi:hypothetical protein
VHGSDLTYGPSQAPARPALAREPAPASAGGDGALWLIGALLAIADLALLVWEAPAASFFRFDEGIQVSAAWFLHAGEMPYRDFYLPYGAAYGIPGLPAELLAGANARLSRISYEIAQPLVVGLSFVLVASRRGIATGLVMAAVASIGQFPAYAWAWSAILVGLLVVQSATGRPPAGSLRRALLTGPGRVLAGSCLIALATWFRYEYAAVLFAWLGCVAWAGRGTPRALLRQLLPPLAVGAAPYVLIAALGGGPHLWTAVHYALFEYRLFRGLELTPELAKQVAEAVLRADQLPAFSLYALAFPVAIVLLLWWGYRLARRLAVRAPAVDSTGVAPFLALAALVLAFTLRTNFTIFQSRNTIPAVALAALSVPIARRSSNWAVAACLLILCLPFAPRLVGKPVAPFRDTDLGDATVSVPGLSGLRVGESTEQSLVALQAAWDDRVPNGSRLFVVNRRNDFALSNEPLLYWLLRARPASWIFIWDPALADQRDEHDTMIDDLCRTAAPVVQHDVMLDRAGNPSTVYSRALDQFVALEYTLAATAGEYRLLRASNDGSCVRPETASSAVVRARRRAWLRAGQLPESGALSTLLIERAVRAGRAPAFSDLAGAIVGGYWVEDRLLARRPDAALLLALRDHATLPPGTRPPAETDRSALGALATWTALVDRRAPGAPVDVDRLRRAVERHPGLPRLTSLLSSVLPPSEATFRQLRVDGVDNAALRRWEFDSLLASGAVEQARAASGAVLRDLDGDSIGQGNLLLALAAAEHSAGRPATARALRARALALPGVAPHAE